MAEGEEVKKEKPTKQVKEKPNKQKKEKPTNRETKKPTKRKAKPTKQEKKTKPTKQEKKADKQEEKKPAKQGKNKKKPTKQEKKAKKFGKGYTNVPLGKSGLTYDERKKCRRSFLARLKIQSGKPLPDQLKKTVGQEESKKMKLPRYYRRNPNPYGVLLVHHPSRKLQKLIDHRQKAHKANEAKKERKKQRAKQAAKRSLEEKDAATEPADKKTKKPEPKKKADKKAKRTTTEAVEGAKPPSEKKKTSKKEEGAKKTVVKAKGEKETGEKEKGTQKTVAKATGKKEEGAKKTVAKAKGEKKTGKKEKGAQKTVAKATGKKEKGAKKAVAKAKREKKTGKKGAKKTVSKAKGEKKKKEAGAKGKRVTKKKVVGKGVKKVVKGGKGKKTIGLIVKGKKIVVKKSGKKLKMTEKEKRAAKKEEKRLALKERSKGLSTEAQRMVAIMRRCMTRRRPKGMTRKTFLRKLISTSRYTVKTRRKKVHTFVKLTYRAKRPFLVKKSVEVPIKKKKKSVGVPSKKMQKPINARNAGCLKKGVTPRAVTRERCRVLMQKAYGEVSRYNGLRKNITPGKVLIILAGKYRGKRVIFLKRLEESGLLLVTGPWALNKCPLYRVQQQFVLATRTTLDISHIKLPDKVNDALFVRKRSVRARRKLENIFAKPKKNERTSKGRKLAQVAVDQQIFAAMRRRKDANMFASYLMVPFNLNGVAPHKVKF